MIRYQTIHFFAYLQCNFGVDLLCQQFVSIFLSSIVLILYLHIATSITQMATSQSQDWKKTSPLLYSYLATVNIAGFSSISSAIFSKAIDKSSIKYEQYKAIIAGKSQSNNGLITINNIHVPQAKDLDDVKAKAVANKVCELPFETQVTFFEEYVPRDSHGSSYESFLILCEKKSPNLFVYQLTTMQKTKNIAINPRLTFKGHETDITALKCRNQEILSGSRNGQLKMYNFKQGGNPITYKYHRDMITDCCWLSSAQGCDDQFASSSTDGIIFLWDKRAPLPTLKIEPKQSDVNCLEFLKENCFLSGGRDGTIKFYDVRGGNSKFYTFKEHSSSVTKIKKLEGNESKESLQGMHQVLFASGSSNGEVILWGEDAEFVHLFHTSEIKSITFDKSTEIFGTVEKKSNSLCLWRPAIFSYQ